MNIQDRSFSHRRRILSSGLNTFYIDKIVSYSPILYYPMNEASGLTALNYGTLGSAADGTYSGPTLADTLGPDGVHMAPRFDGTNDTLNALTAGWQGAYDDTAGTIFAWAKVYNAAVLTDGQMRVIWRNDDAVANDRIELRKNNANNQLRLFWLANGAVIMDETPAFSSTEWFSVAITWSQSNNRIRAFLNGAQQGTDTAYTAHTDVPTVGANLGANRVPAYFFNGWIAHGAFWDVELAPTNILDLATV